VRVRVRVRGRASEQVQETGWEKEKEKEKEKGLGLDWAPGSVWERALVPALAQVRELAPVTARGSATATTQQAPPPRSSLQSPHHPRKRQARPDTGRRPPNVGRKAEDKATGARHPKRQGSAGLGKGFARVIRSWSGVRCGGASLAQSTSRSTGGVSWQT
jgi:hypothetical protein